jgi:hypothetical protein
MTTVTYTCDPNIKLVGRTVQSLTHNMRADAMRDILAEHGLTEVDPDAWYPLQDVLNVLNDIATKKSAMMDFVSIGISAVEFAELSPEMAAMDFATFLKTYAKVFEMRHQGGTPGWIEVEEADEGHITITMNTAYPDDIYYGVWYGYARRFLGEGTPFKVRYDNATRRKGLGGEATIYHITW